MSGLLSPRSLLYVPADKPRAIEKARTLAPDAIILDLEDAVAPENKAAARQNVTEALAQSWPFPVLVRINGLGSEWHAADLEVVQGANVVGVVLPKVESATDLPRTTLPLWAMIETPLGVLNAPAIAAQPSVVGLLVGANDLAYALRTGPHPQRLPLLHALSAVVLAARAAGKVPLDAVYNQVRDLSGFRAECEQGRLLGFAGKTLIHPDQITPAHEVFGISETQAQQARELLQAWDTARAEGKSVAVCGGALVEQMHADRATETLDLWQRQSERGIH